MTDGLFPSKSRDELAELYSMMRWKALDLAQHLDFTIKLLADEYKEDAYKRARDMAYQLCDEEVPPMGGGVLFGKDGITPL